MPCFRGIDLSVVATSDNTAFPEFPHPDGSSARFDRLRTNRHSGSMFLSPQPRKQGHELHPSLHPSAAQQYADPKISVYIPSAAGTNFFFRYNVTQPPVDQRYLCFRVLINGQDTVSWGIDLDAAVAGTTYQALFEPSGQYERCIDGVLMTQYGIESRCFRFVTHGAERASVADDGGLIEVQVFRAKARSRRAPQPEPYRGRDKYGIALVSNGLLEDPQAASYYDYHLVDATDAPYASFRFHYRSWENLWSLQLAPAEKPGFLCGSPSGRSQKPTPTTPSPDFDAQGARNKRPLPQLPTAASEARKRNMQRTSASPVMPPLAYTDSDDGLSDGIAQTEGYRLKHMAPFTDDLCKLEVEPLSSWR